MGEPARVPLSDALSRLRRAHANNPAERRRFRRLSLVLDGRMLDGAGREQDCRTEDISPGDARVTSSATLAKDERVIIYLADVGRVSGRVARVSGDREYAIIFDMSAHKRERLAERLTYLITRERLGIRDPEAARAAPTRGEVEIAIDGGGLIIGEILDFSLSGVTIRTTQTPPLIGAWVRIGGVHGRVARFFESGFAIDFESHARP